MLKSYIDESGIHKNQCELCCVGGYFGSESPMAHFERQWDKILNRFGIEEFHAKRFWARDSQGNRVKPYENWTEEKAEKFINALLTEIMEHRIFPIGATILKSAWDALGGDERIFLTGGRYRKKWIRSGAKSKPYFLGFQMAILGPALRCPIGDKVHFVFDLNDQLKGHALNLYELLKNDPSLSVRDRLGELSFPTSLEAKPLQAADLLVYKMYKYGIEKVSNPRTKFDYILDRAMKNLKSPKDWPFFNAEGFKNALKSPRFLLIKNEINAKTGKQNPNPAAREGGPLTPSQGEAYRRYAPARKAEAEG